MNLRLMLDETAKRYPEKPAIIMGERRISYAELDQASNKVANALLKNGLNKGDRVAMLMVNSPEFVNIFFGIIKAGGIVVPLDIRYKIGELASIMGSCQPKLLVAENPCLEALVPALSQFKTITHVIDMTSSYEKFLSYQEIMTKSPAQKVETEIKPGDITLLAYTSAPTIHPRGSMFSHRTLITETKIISKYGFGITDKDTMMVFALPLHHMFGLSSGLLPSLLKGSTIVLVPGTGISIGSLMEAIEKEKGTVLLGVPYIFDLAVKMAEREGIKNDLSSLRLCCAGGAPVPVDTIRQFKRYYGLTLNDIWGLTEVVSLVTCRPIGSKLKLGSSGKALPGWEIKIVDVDDGSTVLPVNQEGEIMVRGPITEGYYKNPQATAEAIINGWLHTGDIGRLDKDGNLFLTGRKKSLIILKGQNIYPSDVEEVLRSYHKIADAKVVGVPDKLRGEIVRAYIVLKKGEAATEHEIKQFCLKLMADYKSPREVIFLKDLSPASITRAQANIPKDKPGKN